MGGMKLCRVAWSAGAAIALWMIVNGSAWAGVWSPMPQSPQMVGIYNGKSQKVSGETLMIVEGQTLELYGKSKDLDTLTDGTTTTTQDDEANVIWSANGGGAVDDPPRRVSDGKMTITPPPVPPGAPYFTFTVTAQADDYRTEDDPPGSLPPPHTGNRNDAYGNSHTVTIKVLKVCPSNVSISSTCTDPPDWTAYWNANYGVRAYGFLATRMAVSGGSPPNPPNNWNGLVIKEAVVVHPTDPGTALDGDFEIGVTRAGFCKGSGQFIVGLAPGTTSVGTCTFPAAENSFWDFHGTGPKEYTLIKEGVPTRTVNCRQVYKCKDTNLTPSFKITRSISNVYVGDIRKNQVPTTKTAE